MKSCFYSWTMVVLTACLLAPRAFAQDAEEAESKWSFGGDVRLRLTHVDVQNSQKDNYIRVRERLRVGYAFTDDVRFDLQLTNKWREYSTSARDPNNPDDSGAYNYKFPDELILDRFRLTLSNVGDLPLDIVIGRQEVILGNGMLILEGTPMDVGRTIYYDGVVMRYRGEADTTTLLYLYNRELDDFVLLHDQDRQLRPGEWQIAGAYWTHCFDASFNTDIYLLYADVNDTDNSSDLEAFIPGVRLFGAIGDSPFRYSLEAATQRGEMEGTVDVETWIIDARLDYFSKTESSYKPHVQLQYTYFSGDDASSSDYEGFYPWLGSAYPIYREELYLHMTRGNWTNLHQYRIAGDVNLLVDAQDKPLLKYTAQYHYLMADEGSAFGDEYGHLYSMFLDYYPTKNLIFRLEGSYFDAGDYYAQGDNAEWVRFETVFTF